VALGFYAVPHAMKDYRDFDAQLDTIVFCLSQQSAHAGRPGGMLGEPKGARVRSYTLLMYRGGLYRQSGRSHRRSAIITLRSSGCAIERLPETFEYPEGYSPEKHSQGIFGIIDGPQTAVELLIKDAQTRAYLESRRIHPTQQFRPRRDGRTVLSMTVRGTDELKYWILGFGPHIEVLRPAALRNEVAALLNAAARAYR
jgi:proteasome accessory factor B